MAWAFNGSGGSTSLNFGGGIAFGGQDEGAPDLGDKVGGFLRSTLESFPELFGIEPSEATQTYRAQNPVSSFLSQAVGAFVPYAGGAKALRLIPWARTAIEAAEGLSAKPVISAALGGMTEAAMLEAGRLGIAATGAPAAVYGAVTGQTPETRPLSEMAGESLVNIGGAGVLGGVLGGLGARFAKPPNIADLVPDAAPDQPLVKQIRGLDQAIGDAQNPDNPLQFTDETMTRLANERDARIRMNLLDTDPSYSDTGEVVPRSGVYRQDQGKVYRDLEGEKEVKKGGGEISNFLNRTNRWDNNIDKLTSTRRLIYDPSERGGYDNYDQLASDLQNIAGDSSADPNVVRTNLGMYAQDVKTIEVKTGVGKKPEPPATDEPSLEDLAPSMTPAQAQGQRLLTVEPAYNKTTRDPLLGRARGLQRRFSDPKVWNDVGQGWKLANETDGLFVMVKKIAGDPAEAAPGDKWAFLRTDRPDVFAPQAARTNEILMRSPYFPQTPEVDTLADPIFREGKKFLDETANPELVKKEAKAQKDNSLGRAQGTLKESLETVGTYGAPTHFLGTRNPTLARGFRYIRNLKEVADGRVDELMRGIQKQLPGKTQIQGLITFKPNVTEGLENRIMELEPKDLHDVQFIADAGLNLDKVNELAMREDLNGEPLISPKAHKLVTALNILANSYADRYEALQNAGLGADAANMISQFNRREGHYLLTHEYPGAYKQLLVDDAGQIKGLSSGDTPKQVNEATKSIIEFHAKRGLNLKPGGMFDEVMRTPEQISAFKRKYNQPGFIKARGTMLGYELQRGELDNIKLRDMVEKNLQVRENSIRNMAIVEHLGDTVNELSRRHPQDAIALQKRIDYLVNGDEGAFGKAQNAIVDKALHAVGFSGKDNATKIVHESQKLLSHFAFNFLSMSQPIQNILGIFQNLLPTLSFVVNASEETLARHYVTYPLLDGTNNLKGSLGVLSEVKLLGRAIKRLGMNERDMEPDFKALQEELMRRRLVAPRFADAYGIDGAVMRDPTMAWRSTKNFSRFLGSLNSTLMSKSEEISRAMTVNAFYEMSKLRGMNFNQTVRWTSEGIAKTNYNYGTIDKATVFTTPLGSLAGTFKNWMFHYIGNMLEFASEGKEGLPALFWQTAATATLGGAAATPFLLPIANGASQFLTNHSAMQSLYSAAGFLGIDDRVADGIMYGLPGSLGVSLTSQFNSPGSDPKRDAQMIFSFAAFDRIKALGQVTKDALVAYKASGESPWEDETVRTELMRAFAPRTIYRAMQLTQDGAIKSATTGYDVTHPMGLGGALAYAAGVSPTELQKTYEVYSQIKDKEADQKELTQQLGKTLAQAIENNDDRLANRVYIRSLALGLDVSSVLRSATSREARAGQTQLEAQASPQDQEDYGFMFQQ